MADKQANTSEAGWALVMGGVTSARVDAHRLRKLLSHLQNCVDRSPHRKQWYQMTGDLVMGIPGALERLERSLDRTSYALAKIGEEHLRDRLSISDRAMVEDGVTSPRPWSHSRSKFSAERLARRFLERQLGA